MNLNEAKRIVGLRPSESVSGRAAIEAAIRRAVAGIVRARRAGNDALAADLSAAKEAFRARLRGATCETCGRPVSRGATRCRLHARAAGRLSGGPAVPDSGPRPPGNARVGVAPVGGTLAQFGFYAGPVQAVAARWRDRVPAGRIEHYAERIGAAVLLGAGLHLGELPRTHWGLVFDLGAALTAVLADQTRPDAWLLTLGIVGVAKNGHFDGWQEVRAAILRAGGPPFTPAALRQAYKRLRLATPKDVATEWRGFLRARVVTKTGP